MTWFKRLWGSSNDRLMRPFFQRVPEVAAFEKDLKASSDEQLKNRTVSLRSQLDQGASLERILPEAFAVVREASSRVLGMRPFDVQLVGGMALHHGMIAEMRTGEGKTLVATLPVYLNALSGKGCHVVTVNDYLARRDAETMGDLYRFLGLSVGYIIHDMDDQARREAYNADVTYATNNELGFDYLRDHMKFHTYERVQRPFHYAIVDEVDSILIDEARTPLIISGAVEHSLELYQAMDMLVQHLAEEADYKKDEKNKQVFLTDEGGQRLESEMIAAGLMKDGHLYEAQNIHLVHYVNQALKARVLFHRDIDYMVRGQKVVIIDEFTGRMMEGRRYSEGLHQALEAKEGVPIQQESQTLASVTFQNYFRLYPKLAGMTGTAHTEAEEFFHIYNLRVVQVPTHRHVERHDHDDEVYRTHDEKLKAVVQQIEVCVKRKQPVLVGTISIEKSELFSHALKQKKIEHRVLNAKYHEKEAEIIADAGRPGAVTIATNMAGRGTDIRMGGLKPLKEDGKEAFKLWEKAATQARNAGGLFIIGTERHESRRIDNQLRGRSGRQGDPGDSKFFVSLEDDLMRIFGSERLDRMLVKLGLQEGEALVHPWINKALEKAQRKVEARNYDVRKHLLKYDDVMNDQRRVIYDLRYEMMESHNLKMRFREMVMDMIEHTAEGTLPQDDYPETWDLVRLSQDAESIFGITFDWASWVEEETHIKAQDVVDKLVALARESLDKKEAFLGERVMRHMEKTIMMRYLDQVWKSHLLALDHVRQGINLRSYGQRDPLHEYKSEAFTLFENMWGHFKYLVVQAVCCLDLNRESIQQQVGEYDDDTLEDFLAEQMGLVKRSDPVPLESWANTSRNAPCPCGSGKKYKHCHGELKH